MIAFPHLQSSTCTVYDILGTLYGCGNDTQKAKIRVNFTNLTVSNFSAILDSCERDPDPVSSSEFTISDFLVVRPRFGSVLIRVMLESA